MPKVKDIIAIIESKAPLSQMLDFDCAGLNVGNAEDEVSGILLAQNVTYSTIEECVDIGANLLITHHPCVFGEEPDKYMQSLVDMARGSGINLYSCHTNLDCCDGGLNDEIACKLGMREIKVIDGCARAGKIQPISLVELAGRVSDILDDECVKYVGDSDEMISKVALCSGAGARDEDLVFYAKDHGVHCIIGGESKLSIALMAKDFGVSLIDVGHYTSEIACVDIFAKWLAGYSDIVKVSKRDINPYKSIKNR